MQTPLFRWAIIFGISVLTFPVFGQQPDTLGRPAETVIVDSLKQSDIAVKKSDYPNPKKALIFSIVPGGGQIYNKRWWKLPIVYGTIIGLGYNINYNQDLYRRLRDAYLLKLDGQEHEFTGTNIDNVNSLRTLRDKYDKNTQLSYVYLALAYTLQGIEAFVDAHLKGFDVDEDIGFRIKPEMDYNLALGRPVLGLGVVIPLNGK